MKVFYSWQSFSSSTNRSFIERALRKAAADITADPNVSIEPVIDRDTDGLSGAPSIDAAIFKKIDACDVFVCDISMVVDSSRRGPVPNPNVLFELGYAARALGWGRVVLVLNEVFGRKESLPFDLRQRRVLGYKLAPEDDKQQAREDLVRDLVLALRVMTRREDGLVTDLEAAIESSSPLAVDAALKRAALGVHTALSEPSLAGCMRCVDESEITRRYEVFLQVTDPFAVSLMKAAYWWPFDEFHLLQRAVERVIVPPTPIGEYAPSLIGVLYFPAARLIYLACLAAYAAKKLDLVRFLLSVARYPRRGDRPGGWRGVELIGAADLKLISGLTIKGHAGGRLLDVLLATAPEAGLSIIELDRISLVSSEFDLLLSMVYLDEVDGARGVMDSWAPTSRSISRDSINKMHETLNDSWLALASGFFGGDVNRAKSALDEIIRIVLAIRL